jgi:hypothetical protein
MPVTAELRWFKRGQIPPAAMAWFSGVAPSAREEDRTDRYLIPENEFEAGIKIRASRLEIKQRQVWLAEEQFHPRVHGRIAHWRKWSLDLAAASGADERWIGVRKQRRMQHLQLDESGGVRSTGEPSRHGCNLELSGVSIADEAWWSICFEAPGPGAEDVLRAVVDHVLRQSEPPLLAAGASQGYPAWLASRVAT